MPSCETPSIWGSSSPGSSPGPGYWVSGGRHTIVRPTRPWSGVRRSRSTDVHLATPERPALGVHYGEAATSLDPQDDRRHGGPHPASGRGHQRAGHDGRHREEPRRPGVGRSGQRGERLPGLVPGQQPRKTRVELCLDGDNPLCGFLPGDIPNPDAPISFPDNFPEEAFYFLASSTMNLPGGGRATLTLGVEAAFANTVTNGDQITFARQRIVVVGGPRNTTMHFDHPYGSIDIDTDSSGKGRLVEDVSPATGNFTTALKGNIGPFLSWGAGAPAGYVGDPAIEHTVVGGPLRNTFDATWTGGAATQSLFTVQGKIATNSGVTVDAAVADGNFLDVFASSEADPGELYVAAGGDVPSTPMQADAPAPGATTPRSFYARIDMTGKSMPTKITVRNIGDSPA